MTTPQGNIRSETVTVRRRWFATSSYPLIAALTFMFSASIMSAQEEIFVEGPAGVVFTGTDPETLPDDVIDSGEADYGGAPVEDVVMTAAGTSALAAETTAAASTTSSTGPEDVSPTEATDVSTMIATGGGYDAWTAAVRRTVTDIVVPGALSSHGLKVVRTYSSSTFAGWSWYPGWSVVGQYSTSLGRRVSFPDGRSAHFGSTRAAELGDSALRSSSGTKERIFETTEWENKATGESLGTLYLYLEDGSIVQFSRTSEQCSASTSSNGCATDTFELQTLTDPHGLVTSFTYGTVGTMTHRYLLKVTDVASNTYLTYNRNTTTGELTGITASTGQNVTYAWQTIFYGTNNALSGRVLTGASYGDGTSANASYTYVSTKQEYLDGTLVKQADRLKLKTARDSRADGPMSSIVYDYAAVARHKFQGEIIAERHFEGFNADGTAVEGTLVSSFNRPNHTNTETRGDGPSRKFTFEDFNVDPVEHRIKMKADFNGRNITFAYTKGYVSAVTDRKNAVTSFDNEWILGKPKTVTHPGGTYADGTIFPASTTRYSYVGAGNTDPLFPYFVYSVTDGRGKVTTYSRHPRVVPAGMPAAWKQRIHRIDYPAGGGYETFEYNSFGQVTKHLQRQTGSGPAIYDHAEYDTAGRLKTVWNPTSNATPQPSDAKTTYTYYPLSHVWANRVDTVTDQRGFRSKFEYDRKPNDDAAGTPCSGRGLVTKIRYLDDKHTGQTTPGVADYPSGTFTSAGYDEFGNKTWETNELGQTVTSEYDDYNRLIRTKLPNTADVPNQQPSTNDYTRPGTSNPYLHTAAVVFRATSPAGLIVDQDVDNNFRIKMRREATGTGNIGTTWYTYDDNGNQEKVSDPRLSTRVTTTTYDSRDRKMRMSTPTVSDDYRGGTGQWYYTDWKYDNVGNVTSIRRPDGTVEMKSYDDMNRLLTDQVAGDPQARVTTRAYWPSTN